MVLIKIINVIICSAILQLSKALSLTKLRIVLFLNLLLQKLHKMMENKNVRNIQCTIDYFE